MMNSVYVVEKEFFSSYDSDGSIEILGIYQTQEDAEKAIEIHKKYVKNNYHGSSWLHTYEIEETIFNNFDPKFM